MKIIDNRILDSLTRQAEGSSRKRMNFNLHPGLADPVQRLCNAIEPGTYIRPHRHSDPATWEIFIMLRGSVVLLLFDDAGTVTGREVLSSQGPAIAVEIPPKVWHAVASLESGTVFFEVKQGPYAPAAGPNVAMWSPAEGEAGTARLIAWYKTARIGNRPPAGI